MNNQNLTPIQELHCQAVASIHMLSMCQSFNDQWGIKYYSRQYDKIVERLKAIPKLESNEEHLNDEQVNEVFNADMRVDAGGNLIYTPESH